MIPNNNLSVLPWYTSINQQNARKWWVYGKVYPLYTPGGYLLPWQLITPYDAGLTPASISEITLYDGRTDVSIANITSAVRPFIYKKSFSAFEYDVWVFGGQLPVFPSMNNGRYYLKMIIGGTAYYSEVFTVVNDMSAYLKIEWYDIEDFTMDAGTIVYKYPGGQFKNVLYLQSDIAKPEYPFEEEGETRDGYFFPIKQISEKHYRFSFLASEYLLDVMRFIRMSDYAFIYKNGQEYKLDTFLITPDWEANGDVAAVEAEFDTGTVAKKIGRGYIETSGGDYNKDFNNDFNNQQ